MATKYTTLSQLQTTANAVLNKVKDKGYAVAANLGALASKSEVAKTDLASALATELDGKANSADLGSLASKSEVAEADLASALATKINGKADAATTLAGYGITDAYTKTETDNAIAESVGTVNKPGGSLTASQIASSLLVVGNLGKIYNVTEDFDTTSDFVEGAGKHLPAGTNIQVIDADTTGSSPSYKFDVFAGAYGVATQSGNGLMSSTDKTKLDNADVTAYTGSGAVDVTNHVITVAAASASSSGVGGNAGTMSAADKEKLDNADVTAYTGTGAVSVSNHQISVAAASASASGVGGNAGTMSATDKEKLDDISTATDQEVATMVAGLDDL